MKSFAQAFVLRKRQTKSRSGKEFRRCSAEVKSYSCLAFSVMHLSMSSPRGEKMGGGGGGLDIDRGLLPSYPRVWCTDLSCMITDHGHFFTPFSLLKQLNGLLTDSS